jgi:hypothetical protein
VGIARKTFPQKGGLRRRVHRKGELGKTALPGEKSGEKAARLLYGQHRGDAAVERHQEVAPRRLRGGRHHSSDRLRDQPAVFKLLRDPLGAAERVAKALPEFALLCPHRKIAPIGGALPFRCSDLATKHSGLPEASIPTAIKTAQSTILPSMRTFS